MTFEDYILNPMQKQGKVFNATMREAMRSSYKAKFDSILLREAGKIEYHKFKDEKFNLFYILIKIPSEVVPGFYYDVVLKFFAGADIKDAGLTLNRYNMQVYSNDPSFNFTYAYVFKKNNLVIKELEPKLAKLSRTTAPKETNPEEQIGYVKSLYFAYLYMKQKGLFNTTIAWADAEPYNKSKLLKLVENADTKIEERIREGKKVNIRKKIQVSKDTAKKIDRINISDTTKAKVVTTTKKTPTIRKTKDVTTSKKKK